MKQYIAQQILRVNGQPARCGCTQGVVCAYCVQANLILWEREHKPTDEKNQKLCQEVKKIGVRRVARNMGVRHQTVMGWVNRGRVNPSFLASLEQVVMTLGYKYRDTQKTHH